MLKRIKKYYSKTEEQKQKYKSFFEGKNVVFIPENVSCDIIKRFKLPEAINFRKNWSTITMILFCVKKIIKLFHDKNIVLNKKFIDKKPDVWFIDCNIVVEIDEGNHKSYDSNDEKEREHMFKRHDFKIFQCNQTDPNFNTHKCLGEINSYITKLREKEAVSLVINEIADDFKKMITITKSKELKRYAKSVLRTNKKRTAAIQNKFKTRQKLFTSCKTHTKKNC